MGNRAGAHERTEDGELATGTAPVVTEAETVSVSLVEERPSALGAAAATKLRGRCSGMGTQNAALLLPGHPVHILLRHSVRVDHVPAHVVGHGERLLADGASRLPRVPLHVSHETAAVSVGESADKAAVWTNT